jgi:hypothetical protein
MEEVDDEKEDNEAEEVDRCTPPGWARRRASCLRKGMALGKWQKRFRKKFR